MAKERLAICGGKPVLTGPLPQTYHIGAREINAVKRVMRRGPLSDFLGRAGNKFLGGTEVSKFESYFARKFRVKFTVSFNSATTALEAAASALELEFGSEVIVSPYTMSATFTALLANNVAPIFSDIEEQTFCLDPNLIEERITKKTRAIFTTNLFGGSCDYDKIIPLCKKYKLKLIEDNAQAPGAKYKGKYLGTIGDIGIFSFNVHKTVQSGEGGLLLTNNKEFAFRAQLKRNHGEQVLDDLARADIFVIGTNSRMSEIHAVICLEQIKKLDFLNSKRIILANYLTKRLERISGLTPCRVLPKTTHVYYLYPILFDEKVFGISRKNFAEAMRAEGFAVNEGYVKPMHLLTLFQGKQLYERMPWLNPQDYRKNMCPTVERMYESKLLLTNICRYPLTKKYIDLFVRAVGKIKDNREQLK